MRIYQHIRARAKHPPWVSCPDCVLVYLSYSHLYGKPHLWKKRVYLGIAQTATPPSSITIIITIIIIIIIFFIMIIIIIIRLHCPARPRENAGTEFVCDCGFTSMSERGINIHRRWFVFVFVSVFVFDLHLLFVLCLYLHLLFVLCYTYSPQCLRRASIFIAGALYLNLYLCLYLYCVIRIHLNVWEGDQYSSQVICNCMWFAFVFVFAFAFAFAIAFAFAFVFVLCNTDPPQCLRGGSIFIEGHN